jgi:rhodanese-related sulfurtransferase
MTIIPVLPQPISGGRIDVRTAWERVRDAANVLLDVRSFDEFAGGHAEGAVCIPLPDLERRAGDIPTDRPVLVMCQAGGRSALAVERLRALGMDNIVDVDGGFNKWRQAGLPTIRQTWAIPLERQVRIAAGLLVLSFSLAGFFVSHAFFWGAALIGFMLTLTGALGICPMMSALRSMPWNRVVAAPSLKTD